MAWLGFAGGLVLLGFTAASVVKTFMIPRATRTRVNRSSPVLSRHVPAADGHGSRI